MVIKMTGFKILEHKMYDARTQFLSTQPRLPHGQIIEQLERMGSIPGKSLIPGQRIPDYPPEQIRIALYRPLGRLNKGEDPEAVKEMGPPNSLQYIASALLACGYQVCIFDQLAGAFDISNPQNYPSIKKCEEIGREIEDWNPHALFVTSFTCQFRQGLLVASEIKSKLGIPVIWGGYHVTDVARQFNLAQELEAQNPSGAEILKQDMRNIFQHGIIDYICIGDGVRASTEIIPMLQGKIKPEEVPGLAFFNGQIVLTPNRTRGSLDEFPFLFWPPDYEPNKYYATGRDYPFVLVTSMQGCRFSCSFCSTPISYPGGAKYSSVGRAINELMNIKKHLLDKWPTDKIMINLTDEDWMADPRRVVEFCNAVCDEGLNEFFEFNSFGTLLDAVNRGQIMLPAMRKAGWSFFFYGVESTIDSAAKDWMRPDSKVRDRLSLVQKAVDATSSVGIMPFVDFITGHPNLTNAQLKEDYERLMSLRNIPYSYMPILAPMPGTPLYWEVLWGLKGNGFLDDVTYDTLDANHQTLHVSDGSNVKSLRDEMVQSFYTRSEYANDADQMIIAHPHTRIFFAKMLRKISRDYPNNEVLRKLADKYGS